MEAQTPNDSAAVYLSTDELVYRLHQQKLASDFGAFALRTHDVATLLQEASRACAEGLRSELCKVMELSISRGDFLVVAGVGWRPGVVGHARIGAGSESPAGYAIEIGEPVISNELAADRRFRTPALLIEHGVKRAVNVIIHVDGTPYGVLEVDTSNAGPYNLADSDFLQGFAHLLGAAIGRQHLEQELQRKEALLQKSLQHEHLLALEIHHRVKNSLSLVISLLNMSRRASHGESVDEVLEVASDRVHAIADVHDHLARYGKGDRAPLDVFIGDLCKRIAAAHPEQKLVWTIHAIEVSADRAVSLGLLVNELVTNALKHAYADRSGEVCVSIRREAENLVLEVSDGGVGMPVDVQAKGLGTRVIRSLAHQLRGEVSWQPAHPGTRVVVTFPGEEQRAPKDALS
jgi:two-component sensor histidine kinase